MRRLAVTSISTFISGFARPATTSIVAAGRMSPSTSPQTAKWASASAGVGDVVGRADDVGHREAALLQRGLDGLEAVA